MLSICIPFHNQTTLTHQCLEQLNKTCKTNPELLLIDNGSTEPPENLDKLKDLVFKQKETSFSKSQLLPNDENIGVFPCFKQGLEHTQGDIIAFPHSDLLIWEDKWDERILDEFEKDPKLAVLGFLGSWEVDNWGGRGMGTTSNFQGLDRGSKAQIHGSARADLMPCAVVDGCMMIFRRSFLEQVVDISWPPHHFYDRMLCCEAIQRELHVAMIGIQCDHISGQTANCEEEWKRLACKWAGSELHISHYNEWAVKNIAWMRANCQLHTKAESNGWDEVIYLEAEMRFLQKWRDQLKFVPFKVNSDYSIIHYSK